MSASLVAVVVAVLTADSLAAVPAIPLAPLPEPPAALAKLVRLQTVAGGLDQPIGLEVAQGDPARRLFVVEKTGRIRILKGGKMLGQPFLDLHGKVSGGMEQGLLGLAFHPGYTRNGRFFINYTDTKGDTHVVEHRVSAAPDRADPTPVRELLFLDQPFRNHNGGNLEFGPDGAMWVGTGDGGSANDPFGNGQNPKSLFGKMLRFDVDKGGPPEIVLNGLRNPWRFSFDGGTGDLYIADVGQNKYEEIELLPGGKIGGQNLGWNLMEGMHCLKGDGCNKTGLTLPVVEYSHDDGRSITGGIVYRGKAIPELAGHYFYSDYCSGWVRSFRWSQGAVHDPFEWRSALDPRRQLREVASFGQDHDGELYVVSQEGTLFRMDRAR